MAAKAEKRRPISRRSARLRCLPVTGGLAEQNICAAACAGERGGLAFGAG